MLVHVHMIIGPTPMRPFSAGYTKGKDQLLEKHPRTWQGLSARAKACFAYYFDGSVVAFWPSSFSYAHGMSHAH